MKRINNPSFIFLIACPDQRGIVAAVTDFILKHNGNVVKLDQHVDEQENAFFMRIEWEEKGFSVPFEQLATALHDIQQKFQMRLEFHRSDYVSRAAIFVSRDSHCLFDLLSRIQSGEWNLNIPLIVSNHADLKPVADKFGIEFHAFPMERDNKALQESSELQLLQQHRIDFIILARYMQILSPAFVSHFPHKIINIHHSFLPAFPGAKPYHSAFARGVKIIGATSHYVTDELDTGPIIEQDVIRVSHKDSLDNFIRKGKDLEKIVLARAVWAHLQNKVLVYKSKTIVFD
ncbi:MAG: formyltetrahydrofolate deformylase [Lentisphaerota bacterium]